VGGLKDISELPTDLDTQRLLSPQEQSFFLDALHPPPLRKLGPIDLQRQPSEGDLSGSSSHKKTRGVRRFYKVLQNQAVTCQDWENGVRQGSTHLPPGSGIPS